MKNISDASLETSVSNNSGRNGIAGAAAVGAGAIAAKLLKNVLGHGNQALPSSNAYGSVDAYSGTQQGAVSPANCPQFLLDSVRAVDAAFYRLAPASRIALQKDVECFKLKHEQRQCDLPGKLAAQAEKSFRIANPVGRLLEQRSAQIDEFKALNSTSVSKFEKQVEKLNSPFSEEKFSYAPTVRGGLVNLASGIGDARSLVAILGRENEIFSYDALQCVEAVALLSAAADEHHETEFAKELIDYGVDVIDGICENAIDVATSGGSFLSGVARGYTGLSVTPQRGVERAFAVGELVGATLGLVTDASFIVGGAAAVTGSGALALETGGLLAVPLAPAAEAAAALVVGGASLAPVHWNQLLHAQKMLMKGNDGNTAGPKTSLHQGPASSPIQHDSHKKVLRWSEGRPKFDNPKMQKLLEKTWRKTGVVGNGSTADAVRQELLTGLSVSGKMHIQKAQELIVAWSRVIRENSDASLMDLQSAEHILEELVSSLLEGQ